MTLGVLFSLSLGLLGLTATLLKIRYDVANKGREKTALAEYLRIAIIGIGGSAFLVVATAALLTYKTYADSKGDGVAPGPEQAEVETGPPGRSGGANEHQGPSPPKRMRPDRNRASQIIRTRDRRGAERVLRDSQVFEFLKLYASPDDYGEESSTLYWDDEAATSVRKMRDLLNQNDWHYSAESKLQMFIVKNIYISKDRLQAEVSTQEEWYLPIEDAMGEEVEVEGRSPHFGPFAMSYSLRRKTVTSPWRIVRTTNPYFFKSRN